MQGAFSRLTPVVDVYIPVFAYNERTGFFVHMHPLEPSLTRQITGGILLVSNLRNIILGSILLGRSNLSGRSVRSRD